MGVSFLIRHLRNARQGSTLGRRTMKPFLATFVIAIVFIICASSDATTYYVNPGERIQDAIDGSTDGDTIIVRAGTYTGVGNRDLDFSNGLPAGQTRAITLVSESGADVTIIDCEGTQQGPHRAFYFYSGEGPDSVVDGFIITNGWADYGGGIYCANSSSPTITNCIITDNNAGDNGGGIYCLDGSSPVITDCVISWNSASRCGGGIYCWNYSRPDVMRCVIRHNSAGWGGAVFCSDSSPKIMESTIIKNSADNLGGGIYCRDYSSPTIRNCLFRGNTATIDGGAIYTHDSSPHLTNCTIVGNSGYWCGGLFCYDSTAQVTNCIMWGNSGEEIYVFAGTPPLVNYSDIDGGWSATGSNNINENPLFVTGRLHDYYLSHTAAGQPADSPCVDAGSDTAENIGLSEFTTRSDGMPDEGIVDMGYHAPYALWIYSITRDSNDITIHWSTQPGISYTVQHSTDMENWTDVPVGTTHTWADVGGALESQRYYRVCEQ